jgi:hypothetical protein
MSNIRYHWTGPPYPICDITGMGPEYSQYTILLDGPTMSNIRYHWTGPPYPILGWAQNMVNIRYYWMGPPCPIYDITGRAHHIQYAILLGGPSCLHMQYLILLDGPTISNIRYYWTGPPYPICNITGQAQLPRYAISNITGRAHHIQLVGYWIRSVHPVILDIRSAVSPPNNLGHRIWWASPSFLGIGYSQPIQ